MLDVFIEVGNDTPAVNAPTGGGQLGTSLFSLSYLAIEGSEAEMTVGQERAHPEFLSQGAGLPIVRFGLLNLKRLAMSEALTEEPVCPGLVASLLVLLGEIERTFGKLPGILSTAGQERGLAQPSDGYHMA